MQSNLKPCPFCGGRAIMRERFVHGSANKKHHRAECVECHAVYKNWFKNIDRAAAAWNRRARLENDPLTFNELVALPEDTMIAMVGTKEAVLRGDVEQYGITYGAYRRASEGGREE